MNFLKSLSEMQKITVGILIVILINFISYHFFLRYDLTKNNIYSLSEPTKKMVGSLDDQVTVKVFFTDNLPAQYANNRRYLKDQLDELRSLSDGKLNYQIVDPAGNQELEKEADQFKIPSVQVNVYENERYEVKKAFMGLAILYEDKRETIPVIQSLDNFEFEFATTLNRMINKKLPTLATSTDLGMPGWEKREGLRQYLSKQFNLATISVSDSTGIPDSITSLILFTPRDSVKGNSEKNIKTFLQRGGKLAWLFDRVQVNLQQGSGSDVNNGMQSLFKEYGLIIPGNLVQDWQCAAISVSDPNSQMPFPIQVQLPYLPIISNFSSESPISRGLDAVSPVFASQIMLDSIPQNLKMDIILKTSSAAKIVSGFYMINPYEEWNKSLFVDQNLPIAVSLEGKFGTSETPGKLFLLTDSELSEDSYIRNGANVQLMLNIIYWISDEKGLMAIPSKKDFIQPLPEMDNSLKASVRYANLILPPVLILVWGILRWRKRKKLAEQ